MPPEPTVVDTNAIPWEERPNEKIGRSIFRKRALAPLELISRSKAE